ncbi:PREDICTED: protein FAM124B [Chinchilla lanigera]|uniref:Family with sequence similarity 124 member B n=1 Tax=Chinchilla lanigera TaxID=34839 RepID=A0A8C2YP87_CHILA|nr:PREDICTED: protein FAM124B [Chinchilla lanigera]
MEETREPLPMTVHLLADCGHGSLLQQALDQLLECIRPELRLFLVSERVRPVKYYEKFHPRRSRFPGMSVLLFLNESLGEERLLRALESLQQPPWQCYPPQDPQGRLCPYLLASQEFYSLDSRMPVWGVRQVHCGAELLRLTLYCSFDNYEDAIRLYEMILQREATLQKSNFCFFVLCATESFSLQLSLKQLPPGMAVDPKESCVLQFKVQEIGQLVALLPNPCVPISSTRWQTQDYDGNKILLQVQSNPGLGSRNSELSVLSGTMEADSPHPGPRLTSVSAQRTLEPRSRRSRARKFKVRSLELPQPSGTPEASSIGVPRRSPGWTAQASSSAASTQHRLPSLPLGLGARMKILQENSFQMLEAEMNVDTGFTVINSEPRPSFWSRFPKDLRVSQPSSVSGSFFEVTAIKNKRVPKEQGHPLSLAGQSEFGTRKMTSRCLLHLPLQGEEKEEEEFFI